MTDRYERIRSALAMGPTPGPWSVYEHRAHWTSFMIMRGGSVRNQLAQFFNWQDRGFDVNAEKNAKFVSACDPDTIRALLAERDALLSACKTALAWSDQDWVGYEQVGSAVGMANATAAGSPMREGGDHD